MTVTVNSGRTVTYTMIESKHSSKVVVLFQVQGFFAVSSLSVSTVHSQRGPGPGALIACQTRRSHGLGLGGMRCSTAARRGGRGKTRGRSHFRVRLTASDSLSHGRPLPQARAGTRDAGAGFLQARVSRFARAFRPGLGSGPTRIKYAT